MSIVIATLVALALLILSPSPSANGVAATAPTQPPVVYDAIPPIGL